MDFTKDLRPRLQARYDRALAILQASSRTLIGHIDCGVAPHPGIGWEEGEAPPHWLRVDLGRDFLAGDPGAPPLTDLVIGPGRVDRLTDFPDHGIKTLSIILSNHPELIGVAPECQVVPVRIADGPIFQDRAQRDSMGRAMDHLLGLDPVPRVISISMGNPGRVGLLQPIFSGLGQAPGFDRDTRAAFDRAYEMGVIVVAAAGQVIDRVVYPARYTRTIAVGGFRKGRTELYPPSDYDIPERVDIYAQADGINRAFARLRADGTVERGWAEDEGSSTDKISGTSYATPQVAAAAALWVETHFHDLPAPGTQEAWRTVEAFRRALRGSADMVSLKLGGSRNRVTRRCLDIDGLLGASPLPLPGDGEKASAVVRHGNQA